MSVPGAECESTRVGGSPALRVALGTTAGFALVALVDAAAIAWALPLPRGGLGLRLALHAVGAAETIGIGALLGLASGLFRRFAALPFWASGLVYAAAATTILHAVLGGDLLRQATVLLEGRLETPLFVVYLVLTATGFGAATVIGAFLSGSRYRTLRFLPIAVSVAALILDHLVLTDDYFGVHGAVAWVAGTLSGAALGPLAERAALSLAARRGGRVALAMGALTAALGVFLPPSNRIRGELFRNPCSLSWALAATVWRAPSLAGPTAATAATAAAPPSASLWLASRSSLPPIPPTRPSLLARSPIVVLITIDALRADAVSDPANDKLFPTLTEQKRVGAFFTRASSPGSQTAVSLSTAFSGRYFSELYWAMHGTGSSRFMYAAEDASPRFPELLARRGVRTATYASINFLAGEFGVTRGFQEERMIATGRGHALAREVIDPVIDRLRRAGSGPLFLYVHLTEPHAPYSRGKREGTDRERYLSAAAVADAQIARVTQLLAERFADRAILIISADHGEAFGEHGTFQHSKTLYEELLRVPLLFAGPGIVARTIDARVGLIDLGPTILDLFGVETPASYLGQSLVPLLRGGDAPLTRPLLSEGRLRRALYYGDDLKVIEDPRRKVVELYDLAADPGEQKNLFDRDPARGGAALAALRGFFSAHTLAREGYEAPYKP